MANSPQIVVIGSLIMDLVVRADRAPEPGETVIGNSFGRYPGGKGANQAVAAARLGANTALIGKLGNDLFAEDQRKSLGAAGIDLSAVATDVDAPSGVASIIVEGSGQNRIAIVPGANHKVTAEDIWAQRSLIAAADFLLVQLELPLSTTMAGIEVAAEVGTPVIFNPAPARSLDTNLFRQVSVMTPNEVEAEQLTGVKIASPSDAEVAGQKLLAAGTRAVVITLGAQGALVMEGPNSSGLPQATHIPPFAVSAVDTVAAGDAFNGALAVSLAEGNPLLEAAKFASAVAAISVTRYGAQPAMPTRAEVENFLRQQSQP